MTHQQGLLIEIAVQPSLPSVKKHVSQCFKPKFPEANFINKKIHIRFMNLLLRTENKSFYGTTC